MTHVITLQVGSPHVLRDHLRKAAECYDLGTNTRHTLEDAIAQIDEQVKPAIEEPTEFGSIVRASENLGTWLWQKTPAHGKHYWESETGACAVWSELSDIEVLRVGIGEPAAKSKETLAAYDEGYGNGQYAGFSQALGSAAGKVSTLRAEAITSERKNAYDVVLNLLAELQP